MKERRRFVLEWDKFSVISLLLCDFADLREPRREKFAQPSLTRPEFPQRRKAAQKEREAI